MAGGEAARSVSPYAAVVTSVLVIRTIQERHCFRGLRLRDEQIGRLDYTKYSGGVASTHYSHYSAGLQHGASELGFQVAAVRAYYDEIGHVSRIEVVLLAFMGSAI